VFVNQFNPGPTTSEKPREKTIKKQRKTFEKLIAPQFLLENAKTGKKVAIKESTGKNMSRKTMPSTA
jgi:hypothetical protein